ncbi:MAG: hypothetical protein COY81_03105 [Candidatus Pacebacteria bacterium CG_4_10_14_0_8_um_filter_43_12]|nr:MAG: hypothetical protein COU66_04190 [Candidatus Pacebacteria bacterium CG10_big_fil_rev_8_21_14_0_10_44_11]PIY79376.1 MAG: hypothetical protein COY81_03105 [Candidatus Pacebacteria bacterium CG_4_10_14_0_8_um_filter_43_12]
MEESVDTPILTKRRPTTVAKMLVALGLLAITLTTVFLLQTIQSDNRSKAAEERSQSQITAAACPADKLECLNGSTVTRDPNNRCLFTACATVK